MRGQTEQCRAVQRLGTVMKVCSDGIDMLGSAAGGYMAVTLRWTSVVVGTTSKRATKAHDLKKTGSTARAAPRTAARAGLERSTSGRASGDGSEPSSPRCGKYVDRDGRIEITRGIVEECAAGPMAV